MNFSPKVHGGRHWGQKHDPTTRLAKSDFFLQNLTTAFFHFEVFLCVSAWRVWVGHVNISLLSYSCAFSTALLSYRFAFAFI